MFVIQVGKMEVEEKEIATKGQDHEIGNDEEKDQGLVQEIEVNESVVEDQGPEKESDEDLDQEIRRKVGEVLDHVQEIDAIEGTGIEKVERVELKRMILISKKSPFGKMKSMSKRSPWKVWVMMAMAEGMESTMIRV